MIIDATDLIIGRMASFAAKQVLLGEKVDIVNCEKAVITGSKKMIKDKYLQKVKRGIPKSGPFYPKQSDRIVRRVVRGMLPFKKNRGREAFKRVMCYIGVPEKFQTQKFETIENANIKKLPNLGYVYLKEVSKEVGGKI